MRDASGGEDLEWTNVPKIGASASLAIFALVASWALSLFFNQEASEYLAASGLALMVFLAAVFVFCRGARQVNLSVPIILLWGFWGWLGLMSLISPVAYASDAFLWMMVSLPAAATGGYLLFSLAPISWRYAWGLLLFGTLTLSGYGFYQYFVLGESAEATFINKNSFAALLNLIVLYQIGHALALADARDAAYQTLAHTLVALVLVFLIGLIGSRGAFAVLVVGVASILLYSLRLGFSKRLIAWAAGLFSIAIVAANFASGGDLGQRLDDLQSPYEAGSLTSRLAIWQGTLSLLINHLWTGVGPGLYWLYYPSFRLPADASAGFYAHNDYLQLVTEAGLPALVVLLTFFCALGTKVLFALRQSQLSINKRMEIFALFIALGGMLGHSMLTFNLYLMPLLIVFGLFCGRLCERLQTAGVKKRFQVKYQSVTAVVLVALLMLVAVPFYIRAGLAGLESADATLAHQQKNWSVAETSYKRAIDYWPEVDVYYYSLAWSMFQSGVEPPLRKEVFGYLDLAENLNPVRPQIHLIRARLLEEWGEQHTEGEIEEGYRKALSLDPSFLSARFYFARYLLARNQIDAGVQLLEDGLEWPYDASLTKFNYYRLTAEMRRIRGDREGYNALLAEAQIIAKQLQRRARLQN